jgi:hypothetical protein
LGVVFLIFRKTPSPESNLACLSLVSELSVHPAFISVHSDAVACNPSLVFRDGHFKAIIRGILPINNKTVNKSTPTTENWIVDLDQNLTLIQAQKIDDLWVRETIPSALLGLEDGRLFVWKSQEWVLFSGFSDAAGGGKNTMVLCRLEGNQLFDAVELKSPFRKLREKNWMPWVLGEDLFFVYSCSPLEIFKYMGEGKLQRTSYPKPSVASMQLKRFKPNTFISGSSQVIPWDEGFLAVVHYRERMHSLQRFWMKFFNRDKDYQVRKVLFRHLLILFGEDFSIKAVSQPFRFELDGVEFCAGLAVKDRTVFLSYGLLDREAKVIQMDERTLKKMLILSSHTY